MPRRPARPLLPVLALIALILLVPRLAAAGPHPEDAVLSTAERPVAGLGLVAKLHNLLSVLWVKTGSILEPNGGGASASSGLGTESNSGDNGSILDPDGRR